MRVKQTLDLNMNATLTATMLHDPSTGPDEVVDVDVQEVEMFGETWTEAEMKTHFGELYKFILDAADSNDWEVV